MGRASGLPHIRLAGLSGSAGPRLVAANITAKGADAGICAAARRVATQIPLDFYGLEGYASSMERRIATVGARNSYFVMAGMLTMLVGCGTLMSSRKTVAIPYSPGEVLVTERKCEPKLYPFSLTASFIEALLRIGDQGEGEKLPTDLWWLPPILIVVIPIYMGVSLVADVAIIPVTMWALIDEPNCTTSTSSALIPGYPFLIGASKPRLPQGALLTLSVNQPGKNPVVWFGQQKAEVELASADTISVRVPTDVMGATTLTVENSMGKTRSLPFFITPTKPPLLRVDGVNFDSDKKDGVLSALGSGGIFFMLTNAAGTGEALDVTATVSISNQAHITTPGKLAIGNIRSGESKKVGIPVTAGIDLATGKAVATINFAEAVGFPPDPVRITFSTKKIERPELSIVATTIDDTFYPNRKERLSVGNGNGVVEPGESVEISFRLVNRGTGKSFKTGASITSDSDGVAFLSPTSANLGDVLPGGWFDLRYVISIRKDFHSPQLQMKIRITDEVSRFNKDIPVALRLGESYAKMTSVEIQGRSRSEKAPVLVSGDDLLPAPRTSSTNPDAVAVIIGVRNYKNPDVPIVEYALNDALVFKEYAVRALGIKPENIIFLSDPTKGDLERVFGSSRKPRGQLYNFLKKDKSDVFVFYSGHGAPDLTSHEAYLVPSDADPNYISMNGYSLQGLIDNLNALPARNTVLILDACFSGKSHAGTLIAQASPLMTVVSKPKYGKVNVYASSSSDEISSWYQEKQHGMFTYFFLKGMQTLGQNKQAVTAAGLRDYVAERLPPVARRLHGREQTPEHSGDADLVLFRR